jgi:DNA-binding MarR family transcriptional regulator
MPESEQQEFIPIPPSLADTAGFLLGRAGRIIHDNVEKSLAVLKLSTRELGILRIVDEGPLTQQALGKKHNIDRTTVVQLIDVLEQRELLTRVANSADRRSNLLYLTKRGKKTLAQGVKLAEKEQAKFLAPLEDAEWQSLRLILTKLIEYHMSQLD